MESDKEYTSQSCKVCGHQFQGIYCNQCGEKVLNPKEKSFRYFLGNVLSAITFVDNKFYKTLKLMMLKPGFVSAQFIQGIRIPYIKPISMFFIVNLLYFLFNVSDTFNSKLYSQMNLMPYSGFTKSMVTNRIEKDDVSLEAFRILYEQRSTSLAKLMLIVFVFFTGIFMLVLNARKKMYFYDHLTVSLEFNAMFIFIGNILLHFLVLLLLKLMLLFNVNLGHYLSDTFYTTIAVIIAITILFFVQRRVYQDSVVWSLIKAFLFIPCLAVSMILYRAILFLATIWGI